jgi:hypothetical protein
LRSLKRRWEEDLGAGVHFKDSSRHLVQVEHWSYRKGLEKLVREMNSLQPRRAARLGSRPEWMNAPVSNGTHRSPRKMHAAVLASTRALRTVGTFLRAMSDKFIVEPFRQIRRVKKFNS